jgi:hypothetical protein
MPGADEGQPFGLHTRGAVDSSSGAIQKYVRDNPALATN